MKSGAESGVAAARWRWARGGDYGQESSLPAAALLLAGSLGLGWGFLGSVHPSLSRGDPQISGFGWKMLLLWRSSWELLLVGGELALVRRGDQESPQPLLLGPASAQGCFSGAQAFQEFVRN